MQGEVQCADRDLRMVHEGLPIAHEPRMSPLAKLHDARPRHGHLRREARSSSDHLVLGVGWNSLMRARPADLKIGLVASHCALLMLGIEDEQTIAHLFSHRKGPCPAISK